MVNASHKNGYQEVEGWRHVGIQESHPVQLRFQSQESNLSFISQQLVSKKERDDFLQVFNTLDTDHSGNLEK
jgi:hypothetical protein